MSKPVTKKKTLGTKAPKRKRNPCRQPKEDFAGFTNEQLYRMIDESYNPDTGLEVDPDAAYNELCKRLTKRAEKELDSMIRLQQQAENAIEAAMKRNPDEAFLDEFTMALMMAQDMVSGPVGLLPVIVDILLDSMPELDGDVLKAWAGKAYAAYLSPASVTKNPPTQNISLDCLTIASYSDFSFI